MNTAVKQEAVFVGVNRQAFVVDFNSRENLVAVGAANTIGLWHPLAPDHHGVFATLKGHTKSITGVRFIPNSDYLVSTGEDHLVLVWKKDQDSYKLVQSLSDHEDSVTCIAIIDEFLFATGGADGNINLWAIEDGQVTLAHKFFVKTGFYPLCLAIQDIDEFGNFILAVSGTNNNIYIYSFNKGDISQTFTQSTVLVGHEDWIKCLSFVCEQDHKNYILASGSQDRYIRLWRLKLNELIDHSDEDDSKLILLSNRQFKFSMTHDSHGSFSFEALIMGHDDWVTGLQWHPSYHDKSSTQSKRLQLLSSSADTALMVWEMDDESGIWCCVNRLGEMSIKGASTATGASGGFWSCLWFIDPATKHQYILANGKTGSIRVYKSIDEEAKSFESVLGITGANREITDVVWSKDGKYFNVTSLDQTTRLYAQWSKDREPTWHEFSRPQIHGYDMICYDNISATKFVSGGDEKVLRVFEMTNSISKLLSNLCGIDVVSHDKQDQLPEAASLPVLGLSNKAANEQLEAGEAAQKQQDEEADVQPVVAEKEDILAQLTTPPLEDHLQRYTLFPEIEKLYGHGYEITCCATNKNESLIASACRSNTAKHAGIKVFNVKNDYQLSSQVLLGHSLTITSMEFSPNGDYLLAVSRDRLYSLWKVVDELTAQFELVELNTKAHSRIIWDCAWLPVQNLFVTVSRDKQMKLWDVNTPGESKTSHKFDQAITSVSCYQHAVDDTFLVAVGFESGNVSLVTIDTTTLQITNVTPVDDRITPSNRVSKLSFSSASPEILLSVGSHDTSVRVYSIN
jgi:elongator complex protein 2